VGVLRVSDPAATMEEVVRRLHPQLRKHGFKKQRHAFARDLADGITQAVAFEMGRYEPHPDRRPGPYYGAFRVELGVYVDAVAELHGDPKPRFVRPYDCHLRESVGLLVDGEDTWWTLDQPVDDLADGMAELLSEVVLPWLEGLAAIDAILDAWHEGALRRVLASDVTFALLHYARGDRDVAEEMLRSRLGRTEGRGAAENLVALARRLGLDVSMDDATLVNFLAAERGPA
jgi:hypothetical protein